MARNAPLHCPACTELMNITELTCPHCETRVSGTFQAHGLHQLNAEQLQFVEVFLRCRGNIKEVERDLKISYPTVRSRLDQVVQALGYASASEEAEGQDEATEVLEALDAGTLSFDEAMERLRGRP